MNIIIFILIYLYNCFVIFIYHIFFFLFLYPRVPRLPFLKKKLIRDVSRGNWNEFSQSTSSLFDSTNKKLNCGQSNSYVCPMWNQTKTLKICVCIQFFFFSFSFTKNRFQFLFDFQLISFLSNQLNLEYSDNFNLELILKQTNKLRILINSLFGNWYTLKKRFVWYRKKIRRRGKKIVKMRE